MDTPKDDPRYWGEWAKNNVSFTRDGRIDRSGVCRKCEHLRDVDGSCECYQADDALMPSIRKLGFAGVGICEGCSTIKYPKGPCKCPSNYDPDQA